MEIMLIVMAVLLGLTLVLSIVLSFLLTRRKDKGERHDPKEFGLEYETVKIKTADGLTLTGWFMPVKGSDRAVLILHGHGTGMDLDLHHAQVLHQNGFTVLMIDFRGHARSEGKLITFGYLERRDALAAVAYLKACGMRKVALMGFSMGGMTSILTAPICPEVDAVVDDGAPPRLTSALKGYIVEIGLPKFLAPFLAWLTVVGTSLRLGVNLFAYEPVRWVGKIAPRPLFIIHGDLDQYGPDIDDLLKAAPFAQVWRVPDVGHVQACNGYPEQWNKKVLDFLNCNLA
ncbi:MAG TPA: alpha/beta fold hydrolase [Longilinea sp.]|nr:alpha/beta fold hydrolase [Longilinea sp.]